MPHPLMDSLVELIRNPASGSGLSLLRWEKIICVLRHANLAGTLYHLADSENVLKTYPSFARHHLRSMSIYSARQAQQVRYECREIDRVLGDRGITPIFLKGAGYTLRGSRNSLGRIYTDIDVLVAPEEIEPAQEALRGEAWYRKPMKKYDERYYRKWAHEIPPMKHLFRRAVLDLHHNIIPPISGSAPNSLYLRQAVDTTVDGFHVLSAPAAILHSLVHLFKNEDFSNAFRDLVDLYLLLEEPADTNFWPELTSLVERCNFSLELYYGLRMLRDILGYQAPAWIMATLDQSHRRCRTKFVIEPLFRRAIVPHHPLVRSRGDSVAAQLIYLRGHWIKMPFPILCAHLGIKTWFAVVEKLFGKHQFEKSLTIPHN